MRSTLSCACLILVAAAAAPLADAAEIRVPAYTAYTLPDPAAARITGRGRTPGVTRWTDPAIHVVWYGQLKRPGRLTAKLVLRLPAGAESTLRLTVAGASRRATARAAADGGPVTLDFGAFEVPRPGYHAFSLESLNERGRPFGDLEALLLDGPAIEEAHFNLKERRNAASVHLFYPLPPGTREVAAFHCEVTGLEDPPATFYMACGFHRGYLGMQVISPTERRIIFSVWDSGNEAVDRAKVADDDRVKLVAKGDGVFAGDFGNEGTGGHSHLKYLWKTGQPQRFLVTASPGSAPGRTVFAGYYFHPDRRAWMLISKWDAPKERGGLRGLHSFSENFNGNSGHLVRKARYAAQWVRPAADGPWVELTAATFSHDGTGKSDRLDRLMGVEKGAFFLSHGGFVEGFTTYGQKFTRPATGTPPPDLTKPLPQ